MEMKTVNRNQESDFHRLLLNWKKGTEMYDMLDQLQKAGISVAGSLQKDCETLVGQLYEMAVEGGKIKPAK